MVELERDFQKILAISMGELDPQAPFEWVTNNFAPGTKFQEAYEDFAQSRENLCFRFGMEEDDEDLERIMDGLLKLEEDLARRMFYYGIRYARQNTK